jgi:hypothetical protein
MSENSLVAIICALIALLNLIGMSYLGLIYRSLLSKIDTICEDNSKAHNDMWKRIYGHQHEIDCQSAECGKAKATDIIIPHGVA